jgi:hypothetical protein
MFTKLEGDSAIVRKGGVFKPCDLYEWRGHLFAKFGGGFVRLQADGKASVEGVMLEQLTYEGYEALQSNPDGTIVPLKLEGPK